MKKNEPHILISWQRLTEIVRYGATGALCALLNLLITVFLTAYVGMHYLLSLTVSSVIVMVIGFFLNRSWTFRKDGAGILREFYRYSVTTGLNVVVGLVACPFLVEVMHVPYPHAIVLVAAVVAPMTYIGHRVWTFGLGRIHSGPGQSEA